MFSTSSTSEKPVKRRILHAGSLMMVLGSLCIIVGSLLPWISDFATNSHISGALLWGGRAGYLTAVFGILTLAGAVWPRKWVAIAHCLAGAVPSVIWTVIVLYLITTMNLDPATEGTGWPGMGLVMIAGGAAILLRTAWRLHHGLADRPVDLGD